MTVIIPLRFRRLPSLLTGFVGLLLACLCAGEPAFPELPLRGSAEIRVAWIFKVCDIRLYLPEEVPIDAWDSGRAIALEVSYARPVSADTLIRLADEALSKNFSSEHIRNFETELSAINSAYESVGAGDTYRIEAATGSGMTLLLNNVSKAHIPNPAFAEFYLHIWLGDHPRAVGIRSDLSD